MRRWEGEEGKRLGDEGGAACACRDNYGAASVKLNVRMGAFFMSCECFGLKNVIF